MASAFKYYMKFLEVGCSSFPVRADRMHIDMERQLLESRLLQSKMLSSTQDRVLKRAIFFVVGT